MAETIAYIRPRHKHVRFQGTALSCPDATTPVLLTVYCEFMEKMGLGITETANVVNLDAFTVEYQYHPDGTWITMASAGADYTTPNEPVLKASGDLTALVKNTSGWLVLDIRGAYAVRFGASGNTGIAALTIEGQAW